VQPIRKTLTNRKIHGIPVLTRNKVLGLDVIALSGYHIRNINATFDKKNELVNLLTIYFRKKGDKDGHERRAAGKRRGL
jgi:hypothetical protein